MVGAQLHYDPTKLEVVNIDTSNSVFTMTVEKTADPTTGMIKLTIGKPTPGVNTARGNVATINFKALAQASPACVSFVTDSDRPYITCVCLDDGKGTDILGSVKNGAYFIGGEEQLKAELSLLPATKTVNVGDNFNVDIQVNTGGQNVNVVGAQLNYDPTKLEVVNIDTSNSVFTMTVEKTADPTTGMIKLTIGKPTPGVNTARGNVATINFKALAQASPACVSFVTDSDRPYITCVCLDDGKGTDILGSVKNGAYFIVGENQPQNASFIYSPLNPVVNEGITFDASLSTDLDGMIKSWEWDFGDGSYGNGVIITHAYSTVGNYKVTLTVTDKDDINDLTSKTIQVRSPPIYVPDDYPTIQWAVDNATRGDTIIVRDGLYTENIDVNKPHLMIKSENGSENCIVQAANSNDHVFEVEVEYVNISGFTVKGATGDWQNYNAGIYINRCGYCNISNNIALHNDLGIYLYKSYSNILINNIANQNLHVGIWLYESSNNSLISNMAESNNDYGFFLCFFSNNNTLINNIASEKDIGFSIRSSSNNIVVDNTVSNTIHGITLSFSSDNNIIINNTVSNSWDGIRLYESFNNVITSNTATNNSYGIYLYSSSNNLIYLNNFVNNAGNTHSYWSTNAWNSTSPITYTYNGNTCTNYLGNYWDDYTGSDANDNGIGDTPYRINSDKDDYPLMEPWENYPFLSEALTSKIEIKTKVEEVNNVIKLGNTLFWRLWRR